MVNAALVAMEINGAIPAAETPAHTEGYEGFYHLTDMTGDVESATLSYIIRDHSATRFDSRLDTLRHIEKTMNEKYGAGTVELTIREQYRNMAEVMGAHMHLVETADRVITALGMTPSHEPIRGGTDGARLSFMGLPCPNLGTGGFNFHGVCECTTVERMDKATEILLNIIELYSK